MSTGLGPWTKFDEVVKALGDWVSAPQNFHSERQRLQLMKASPDLLSACSDLLASEASEDNPPIDLDLDIHERMCEQARFLSQTIIKRLAEIEISSPEALATAADAMTSITELRLEDTEEEAYSKALSGLANACCRYLPSPTSTGKPDPSALVQPSASDEDASRYGAQIVTALGSTVRGGVENQNPSEQETPDTGSTSIGDIVRVLDVLASRNAVMIHNDVTLKMWASDSAIVAVIRYIQHLTELPSNLDGMERAKEFVMYYATAIGERKWEVLSSEGTRKRFLEELAKLESMEKGQMKDDSAEPSPLE